MSETTNVLARYADHRVRECEVALKTLEERMGETRAVMHRLSHPNGDSQIHAVDDCALCDARACATDLLGKYASDYAIVATELVAALGGEDAE